MDHTNLVRFEARPEQNGVPPVPIRKLLKAALRPLAYTEEELKKFHNTYSGRACKPDSVPRTIHRSKSHARRSFL